MPKANRAKAKYKGSRFFFPAMIHRDTLPFHHAALAQVSSKSSTSGNTIDHLPAEVLHLIYEYLLKDPRDLVNLAQVSRRFLSAVMKPVQLNESQEWFPFLQSVFEEMLFNHRKRLLEQNKITDTVFLQALKPDENEMDHVVKKELILSLSLKDITKGSAHLNQRIHHQTLHDRYQKRKKDMADPDTMGWIGLTIAVSFTLVIFILMSAAPTVAPLLLVVGLSLIGVALNIYNFYFEHVKAKVTVEGDTLDVIDSTNPFPRMINSINERETVSLDEDEDDEFLMERRAVQA